MRLILARRRAIPVAAYVDFRGTYGQPWSYLRFRSKSMRTCTWRRSRLHLDHCHRIITAVLRLDEHKTHGKYQGSELDWNAWLQRYTDYVSLLIIAEVRPSIPWYRVAQIDGVAAHVQYWSRLFALCVHARKPEMCWTLVYSLANLKCNG